MPACRCVVNRYIQWALTTPTLVYVISRISSFSTKRVALAVGAQVVVIVTGLLSQLSPGIFFCECKAPPVWQAVLDVRHPFVLPYGSHQCVGDQTWQSAVHSLKQWQKVNGSSGSSECKPDMCYSASLHSWPSLAALHHGFGLLCLHQNLLLKGRPQAGAGSADLQCTFGQWHLTASSSCLPISRQPQTTLLCRVGLYICMSFFFYVFVMIEMGKMVGSVLTEESNSEARSGLLFIFWSTVVVWLAFPIYWCCQQLGILSVYNCELGTLVANFVAKVGCPQNSMSSFSWWSCCSQIQLRTTRGT